MARKRKVEEEEEASWLTTFSDLMSLTLCFFVMLYALAGSGMESSNGSSSSTATAEAMAQISASFRGSSSISLFKNPTGLPIYTLLGNGISEMPDLISGDRSKDTGLEQKQDALNQMAENFKTYFAEDPDYANNVEVNVGELSVIISFSDGMLFEKGKANLKPSAINALDTIAAYLNNYPDTTINIEGHTDSDPIKTIQYKDNLALSSDRAGEVGRYLMNEKGIDPYRVVAVGYGEFRPIAPNDTEENKTKNRRVEIKITNTSLSSLSKEY